MWTDPRFVVGADIGQVQDPTAIGVLDRHQGAVLRLLERIPLGTPYPAVVERLGGIMAALPGAALVVDATGVGRPVLDMLKAAGLNPIGILLTSGRDVTVKGGLVGVPKECLVQTAVAALESGSLKIVRGLPEGDRLVQEFRAFHRQVGDAGRVRYEGKGEHDDVVIAVALAVWWAESGQTVRRDQILGRSRL